MARSLRQGMDAGLQKGLQQGLLAGSRLALELRFGIEGLRLLPEIAKIKDVSVLKMVHEAIRVAETPEDLRRIYRPA